MWYEHGQSETLINLDHVMRVKYASPSALLLTMANGMFISLEYQDEVDATEAFHIIREKCIQSGSLPTLMEIANGNS
jgi:hypothetical protein